MKSIVLHFNKLKKGVAIWTRKLTVSEGPAERIEPLGLHILELHVIGPNIQKQDLGST